MKFLIYNFNLNIRIGYSKNHRVLKFSKLNEVDSLDKGVIKFHSSLFFADFGRRIALVYFNNDRNERTEIFIAVVHCETITLTVGRRDFPSETNTIWRGAADQTTSGQHRCTAKRVRSNILGNRSAVISICSVTPFVKIRGEIIPY